MSSDLRRIQQQGVGLLRQFSAFCGEHGIRYFICGGTLLGAARDGRFIPWDDDVDVVVPRADFRRLERLATDHPPAGVYWLGQANPAHAEPNVFWGKFCLSDCEIVDAHANGRVVHHFGLDVLPLDELPRGRFQRVRQRFLSYYYQHLSSLQFGGASPRLRGVKAILRLALAPFNTDARTVADKFRAVAAIGEGSGSGRLVSLCGRYGYAHEQFPAEWFASSVYLPFEGLSLPAASGWRGMLEMAYGKDWMTPRQDVAGRRHYKVREREQS